MDVLIRGLPDEIHAELTRRAAAEGRSLRAHLIEVLSASVATPSMNEWLETVRSLEPVDTAAGTGADLVAEARNDDDALVGR